MADMFISDMPQRFDDRLVPEYAIIVPCYNERGNVSMMVSRLAQALIGLAWEVIFVDDDSPDGTADEARRLGLSDPRVRCIRRVGRRGLSSAVVEGVLSTNAAFIAVLDGDLQHDEACLPRMFTILRDGVGDLVVGSRHVAGGDASGLSSSWRHRLSLEGTRMAKALLPVPLSDPMSGFFATTRKAFEATAPKLNANGFKILLDLVLTSSPPPRLVEVPFRFRKRETGESKMDALVLVQFIGMLLDRALKGIIPLQFISFMLIGGLGVLVNILVVLTVFRATHHFGVAQVVGTLAAMIVNFQLNNALTYRNVRLRGARYVRGLILFLVVCGLGAIANVGIARALFVGATGTMLSSTAGAIVGVVWNYAVSSTLIWQRRVPR